MVNNNGESGHPCLVPDFRGNAFNFSPLRIMFAVGLSYIACIMLRYVPLCGRLRRHTSAGGCMDAGGPRGATPGSRSREVAVRRYASSKVRSWCCALLEQS